jgi:hypothetical protein
LGIVISKSVASAGEGPDVVLDYASQLRDVLKKVACGLWA